jgi:hypothetical protein
MNRFLPGFIVFSLLVLLFIFSLVHTRLIRRRTLIPLLAVLIMILITVHKTAADRILGLEPPSNVNLCLATGSEVGGSQQSETAISVDPNNPLNQVVVAIHHDPVPGGGFAEIFAFYTNDGGWTWAKVNLPRFTHPLGIEFDYVSDPSVAHDHEGNVYAAYNQRNTDANMHFIACSKSEDGGATWTLHAPTETSASYVDKPFVAVDNHPGSPRLGRVHVVWSDRTAVPRATYLSKSADGGITWTTDLVVQNNDNVPELALGPGGDVYVAIAYRDDNEIRLENCGIGGDFCTPANGADVLVASVADDNQNITPQPNRNIPMHPVVDVDRSGGPFRYRVYVAYGDYTDGDPDHMDIFIAWADPDPEFAEVTSFPPENKRQVNLDGTATAQFLPWLDVDDTDGSVGVLYYSAQDDPVNNKSVHAYYAESIDGGETWTNKKISLFPSDETICGGNLDYQEYIGLHNQAGCIYASWTSFVDAASCADILWGWSCAEGVAVLVNKFTAHAINEAVELIWDVTTDEDIRGFQIYRQTDESDVGELIDDDRLISPQVRNYIDESIKAGNTYKYTLVVVREDGSEVQSQTVMVKTKALMLSLHQNHPNPFNPTTTIPFTLPKRVQTRLSIFNIEGKLVRALVDDVLDEGLKETTWDGTDSQGNPVSSGVYFYRLKAGKKVLTRKMVLLR